MKWIHARIEYLFNLVHVIGLMSFYYNIYSVNCKYTYTHYVVHVLSAIFSSQTVGNFAFVLRFFFKFFVRSCRMHRLEWLDLNGNSLTDLGIVSLSKALCDPNSKLKSLGGWGKVEGFPWGLKTTVFLVRLVSQAPLFLT